jgi:hypothetical protein
MYEHQQEKLQYHQTMQRSVISTEGETESWTKFANAFETVVADGFAPAKQTPSKPQRRNLHLK